MVADGGFREDLYYRLRGVVLRTPPLGERTGDVPLLATLFLRRAAADARFSPDALAWLAARTWPGNVRELRAAVECAVALAGADATGALLVEPADLAFAVGQDAPVASGEPIRMTLDEEVALLERRRIVEALDRTGHNHTHTARELGLSRVGLLKKLDRMGLRG
jgi:two-component system NtrC family response regulator